MSAFNCAPGNINVQYQYMAGESQQTGTEHGWPSIYAVLRPLNTNSQYRLATCLSY